MSKSEIKKDTLKDVQFLSTLLDSQFSGPFGFKFGLDGIIGLIPGIGDFVASAIGLYIIVRAASLKVPKAVIYKMSSNLIVDQLVGTIPIFGDLFDFAWKSNKKNATLLKEALQKPVVTERMSKIYLTGLIVAAMMIASIPILIIIFLIKT